MIIIMAISDLQQMPSSTNDGLSIAVKREIGKNRTMIVALGLNFKL